MHDALICREGQSFLALQPPGVAERPVGAKRAPGRREPCAQSSRTVRPVGANRALGRREPRVRSGAGSGCVGCGDGDGNGVGGDAELRAVQGGVEEVAAAVAGAIHPAASDAVVATAVYRLAAFWLPLPAGLAAFIAFRVRIGSTKEVFDSSG